MVFRTGVHLLYLYGMGVRSVVMLYIPKDILYNDYRCFTILFSILSMNIKVLIIKVCNVKMVPKIFTLYYILRL
jgi:hypothetical protein